MYRSWRRILKLRRELEGPRIESQSRILTSVPCVVQYGRCEKAKAISSDSSTNSVNVGQQGKRVFVVFFRTETGREPVRDWLKSLPYPDDSRRIGEDIKTVEFGWPVGMPVCRSLGHGVYEVRSDLSHNRIACVLFYIDRKGRMVLLHGFIKKRRGRPMMIWRTREVTRRSTKGDSNENKKEPQALRLQWLQL